MAIPSITSVTPNRGHSGGGTVLRIVGTNFALPVAPASSGPVPAPPASVRVFIGGIEARRVRVASSTVLYVTTERRDPAKELTLEVRNVGPFGETIGAERAELLEAFEYARPIFTTPSDFERITKALLIELKRQVLEEVVLTAHVDWTDDPSSILRGVRDAKMPSVFLAGPTFRPNAVYRTNERARVELVDGVVLEHRAPKTDDMVFTLGAIAEKQATALSLAAALSDFILRNPFLYVPRAEGSSELVRFDLQGEGDVVLDSGNDESNIRTCSGTIAIAGVDTLAAPGFENDQAITATPVLTDAPELESEPIA